MLKHDYVLVNVSKGFKFKEEAFLAPYVKFHAEKRNNSNSEFEKTENKARLNVLFGKFLSNGLKFPKSEYCFSQVRAIQLLSRDLFEDF